MDEEKNEMGVSRHQMRGTIVRVTDDHVIIKSHQSGKEVRVSIFRQRLVEITHHNHSVRFGHEVLEQSPENGDQVVFLAPTDQNTQNDEGCWGVLPAKHQNGENTPREPLVIGHAHKQKPRFINRIGARLLTARTRARRSKLTLGSKSA